MKPIEQRVEEKAEEIRAMFPIVSQMNKMLNFWIGIRACDLILDALHDCGIPDHDIIDFYELVKINLQNRQANGSN